MRVETQSSTFNPSIIELTSTSYDPILCYIIMLLNNYHWFYFQFMTTIHIYILEPSLSNLCGFETELVLSLESWTITKSLRYIPRFYGLLMNWLRHPFPQQSQAFHMVLFCASVLRSFRTSFSEPRFRLYAVGRDGAVHPLYILYVCIPV